MKTHIQTRCPLIVVFRLAGAIAMIVSISHMLRRIEQANWRLTMCVGLGWLILAAVEECEARLRDAAEKQG